MGILIPRQLTKEQYIKLFSNPVSGIACEFGAVTSIDLDILQNIRYSKSMILRALEFWYDYNYQRYIQIRKIHHIMFDPSTQIGQILDSIKLSYNMIKKYPDSYLFSHRYIKPFPESKYPKSLNIQLKLLQDKLGIKHIFFQEGSLKPFHIFFDYTNKGGIEFTVFPNEHPYIPKQKISRVGMTEKGNVFILHKKGSSGNGAQKTGLQAPIKQNLVKRQELWNKDIAQTVIPNNPTSRILRGLIETWTNNPLFDDDNNE